MTGADTNILVRFLTRDDADQFNKALAFIKRETVFIPDTVWLETEWVLRYAYGFDRKAISQAFRDLLGLPKIHVHDKSHLLLAIEWHAAGLDFADALHLAASQETETFATFDQAFVRRATSLGRSCVVQSKSTYLWNRGRAIRAN
jgi:predicted nucleic-acid-binding protein